MKILQVSGIKSWGGGEQQLFFLAQELQKLQPEIQNTVFCPSEATILIEKLKKEGIPVTHSKLKFKTSPFFFLKLGRYCKSQKIEIVHAHDPVAMFLVILASFFYKMPKCVYSKKTSFPIKQRAKTLYKYNHKIFRKIICVSEAVKFQAALAIKDKAKLVTIYDGIDTGFLDIKTTMSLHELAGVHSSKSIVLNIGNHTKPKDLSTFIKTARNVITKIDNIHFVQIGRFTQQTASLLNEVRLFEIQDKVSFIGEVGTASSFINQASIFLHTSKTEGLGQVIIEAMFAEVPIVSTGVGGIVEIIQHDTNGLLSQSGDFKSLSEQVIRLLDNKELSQKLVSDNKNVVNEKFHKSIMAQNTMKVYQNIA